MPSGRDGSGCLAPLPAVSRALTVTWTYVELDERKRTYDNFFALHELLESLLGRRVDLVTDTSLTETKAKLILPTVRYVTDHG